MNWGGEVGFFFSFFIEWHFLFFVHVFPAMVKGGSGYYGRRPSMGAPRRSTRASAKLKKAPKSSRKWMVSVPIDFYGRPCSNRVGIEGEGDLPPSFFSYLRFAVGDISKNAPFVDLTDEDYVPPMFYEYRDEKGRDILVPFEDTGFPPLTDLQQEEEEDYRETQEMDEDIKETQEVDEEFFNLHPNCPSL